MKKLDFNTGWEVRHLNTENPFQAVTLPHDAMRYEKRSMNSHGIHNIGWYECFDYEYKKTFFAPAEMAEKKLILEFEGIYHNAEIYLNGKKIAERPYGYTQILADISEKLTIGEENELKVIAHNADQPNSRWYSGSGIYRPVYLYESKKDYIPINGLKVKTVDYKEKKIEVYVETSTAGEVKLQIFDMKGNPMTEIFCVESVPSKDGKTCFARLQMTVNGGKLWTLKRPNLYVCKALFAEDAEEAVFGIREIEWGPKNGLSINGKHVILKGACIHSDNQLLGAEVYQEAEERRVRLLKENGYNAIRSAHNPCAKALLDECDRQGMLMMDEYVDMWYIHKNQYDYATYMREWWHEDLKDMVDKDYNHPSVIMYSTGNEVAETGQKEGIALTKAMTEYLHELDDTRPVSCGINIFFNLMYRMGFGVYSDDKAKKDAADASKEPSKKKKAVGSEFYNQVAGLFGDKTMKLGATLYPCDVLTRDSFANMDVAGYNYGLMRYKHDLKKYPNRLILGSETFCKDAYAFYEIAKKHKRLVGDFVWAGQDYLGEAGIGSWEYEDYAPADGEKCNWIAAGSGRIDLTGKPIGEARYTQVAFERSQGPYIAVKPVYQTKKHSPSAWKMSDAIESWSWHGCDGLTASIEVYARAAKVELYLNEKKVGEKSPKNDCIVRFKIPYGDGSLKAISYDEAGNVIGECTLKTAGEETRLRLLPEKETAEKGKLSYIRIRYTDDENIWKPMDHHKLHVDVKNGELVALGNACPYNPDGYLSNDVKTYYGEALAIVRAGESGRLELTASDGTETTELSLEIL